MIGKILSHYKVIEKIGQGGMGEVYRAEDTTLEREVAIKMLPEQFTQDPQEDDHERRSSETMRAWDTGCGKPLEWGVDAVTQECADLTVPKWIDRLGGADIWTFDHCHQVIQSLRID